MIERYDQEWSEVEEKLHQDLKDYISTAWRNTLIGSHELKQKEYVSARQIAVQQYLQASSDLEAAQVNLDRFRFFSLKDKTELIEHARVLFVVDGEIEKIGKHLK